VEGFRATEHEVSAAEKEVAQKEAVAHWLLALTAIESPNRKPCLLLITGLPGTGKSTLAHSLSETSAFKVVSSDVVRKDLAGLSSRMPAKAEFGQGLYTAEWNHRTYAACLERTRELLFAGKRVLVDASFREDSPRRAFSDLAHEMALPCLILNCEADPSEVKKRLELRHQGASDANWNTDLHASDRWDSQADSSSHFTRNLQTDCGERETANAARSVLETAGLA
jgi:hypothetical protein